MRKIIASVLCISILLSLSSCIFRSRKITDNKLPDTPFSSQPVDTNFTPLVDGDYFPEYSGGDTKFDDMKLQEVDEDEFNRLCDELEAYAETNDSEGFMQKYNHLNEMLHTIVTNYNLLEIMNYQDPSDEEISDKCYEESVFAIAAQTALTIALKSVLESEHSAVANDISEEIREYALSYDEENSEENNKLLDKETELTLKYGELMIADEIDPYQIGEVYLDLVETRKQIATLNGYDSYAEYAYENVFGRNYTPDDVSALCESVKNDIVPYYLEHIDEIEDAEATLSYSELDVSSARIKDMMEYGAKRLSSEVIDAYNTLIDLNLNDIEPSMTKNNTGFTTYITNYKEPFIFNSPYENYLDYTTMFHEFGHFVSSYYNPEDSVWGYCDYDLAELQSQGMEVIFTLFYDEIFGEYSVEAKQSTIGNLMRSVIEGCIYDEFQRRVFEEKNLTTTRVCEIFYETAESYGYEDMLYYGEYDWMLISHNFESAFYYVSYAVSALSALEIAALIPNGEKEAAETYMKALSLPIGEYSFTGALEEIGLDNLFDDNIGDSLINNIDKLDYFS
ncbi:MAG: M3 family metallopeptidase [Clostridia bacterium]|nr:M3 family metallopeptidase [Clostridia bacterium]